MDLYADTVLDHYRHPRGKQRLPAPSVSHEEVNVSCGDTLTIDLQFKNDCLESIGWEGGGCAISQAAMSMLAEDLAGKSFDELSSLKKEDIYAMLGVPIGPRRTKCALLCLHALNNALRKFKNQDVQGWTAIIA